MATPGGSTATTTTFGKFRPRAARILAVQGSSKIHTKPFKGNHPHFFGSSA